MPLLPEDLRFHGLTVMTADSDSASEGSTPSETFLFDLYTTHSENNHSRHTLVLLVRILEEDNLHSHVIPHIPAHGRIRRHRSQKQSPS